MSIIFADYSALVKITPEMDMLRKCPECNPVIGKTPFNFFIGCPTCGGTNANPDESKFWKALQYKGEWTGIFESVRGRYTIVLFCEYPGENSKHQHVSGGPLDSYIHRPENDLRPWNKVLKDLIEVTCNYPVEHRAIAPDIEPSFALATRESAPVFESFGIETLVRFGS